MSDMYFAPEGTDPNDPKAWGNLEGIEPTGYSTRLAVVDEVEGQPLTASYLANMKFTLLSGRGYGKANFARHFWQETPREELQRRLNNWLQGTYPGEPLNWKGLK